MSHGSRNLIKSSRQNMASAMVNCESLYVLVPVSILTFLVLWYFLKLMLPKPLVSDFKNKFVLITGCDSGFGRMSAIRLDKMGFRVIGTCLTKEGKESLESVCSDRLIGMLMNVTDSKQIHDVFVKVKDIVGGKGLWALVNIAGILLSVGPLEWYKMDAFRKMADVNLWGLIEVTKTFLPLVKKAEGRIVNVSSILGFVSWSLLAPYNITKYGVEAFSDTLRREMKRWKVKVCIIEPQVFKTALLDGMLDKIDRLWDSVDDEMKTEYRELYSQLRSKDRRPSLTKAASPNVHLVIEAIVDAVTSVNPSPRYLVGLFAKYFAFLFHLPTFIQDKCI